MFTLKAAAGSPRGVSGAQQVKMLYLILPVIASVLSSALADADRIIEQFNIVVDKLASDPQRALIYKVTIVCLFKSPSFFFV